MSTLNISFQIMTRAEPVSLVKDTIDALLAIKASGDEILIIDNNHTDKSLYQPLQAYCESLDDSLKVRFFHEDYIAGYKAGALNYALHKMDDDCEYIVVVDSDYQALPWARASIASAIKTYPNHALLQFPQYYRDTDKPDIHGELNHYFSKHLRADNNLIHSLSTGTFAVINRRALEQLGGWSGDSITEDAQMGVLMHLQLQRTCYIPQVIATGVLPNSLADLMGQRRRWIYGNAQVLASYPKMLYGHRAGRFNRSTLTMIGAHLSQLSAWINLTGLFIGLHIIGLAVLVLSLLTNMTDLVPLALAGIGVCYLSYAVFIGRRLYAYMADTQPLLTPYGVQLQAISGKQNIYDRKWLTDTASQQVTKQARLQAWLVHLSFWELGALSWLPVLWGQKKPFVCTPKFIHTDKHQHSMIASAMVLPKLLLIVNALTVVLVAPHSLTLSILALSVLLLKLLSHWKIADNFVTKPQKITSPIAMKYKTEYKADRSSNNGLLDEVLANYVAINDELFEGYMSQISKSTLLAFNKTSVITKPAHIKNNIDQGTSINNANFNNANLNNANLNNGNPNNIQLNDTQIWGRYDDNCYDSYHSEHSHKDEDTIACP